MTALLYVTVTALLYVTTSSVPLAGWERLGVFVRRLFVRALLGLCQGFVRALSGLCPGFVRALSGLCQGFVRMLCGRAAPVGMWGLPCRLWGVAGGGKTSEPRFLECERDRVIAIFL